MANETVSADQPTGRSGESFDPVRDAVAHCHLPEVEQRTFGAGFDPGRALAILVTSDKWMNGTELRYHFVEDPPDAADKQVVRDAFAQWQKVPIGLKFREVEDRNEAEIRIGFDQNDGSWSYVGRQVLSRPQREKTMNFGWRLSGWSYGKDTALHEIGHTLGLPHEHQNPNAGIVWDEAKVLAYFGGPPNNWPDDQTRWNILRKISPDKVQGSTWDNDSVMHYRFEAGLIQKPTEYQTKPLAPAGGLSARDLEWIKQFYPGQPVQDLPDLVPFKSQPLSITAGQQVDFEVRPPSTRKYTVGTFGSVDTVLAVFEDVTTGPAEGQGLRFRSGDDDSGTDDNARLSLKLFKGVRYVVRLRLYWSWSTGDTALMLW